MVWYLVKHRDFILHRCGYLKCITDSLGTIESYVKHHFSVNMWCGIMSDPADQIMHPIATSDR
jgi:hypothetical protein